MVQLKNQLVEKSVTDDDHVSYFPQQTGPYFNRVVFNVNKVILCQTSFELTFDWPIVNQSPFIERLRERKITTHPKMIKYIKLYLQ